MPESMTLVNDDEDDDSDGSDDSSVEEGGTTAKKPSSISLPLDADRGGAFACRPASQCCVL